VLPANRAKFNNQMPPFAAAFTDADIAETLTFVRKYFGKGASPVTPQQVAALRKK
jgi:mono/diheme cytochrome c family protein